MSVEIITNKLNPQVLPHLHIWGWEIPVYLFLGGLAGGLLIIVHIGIGIGVYTGVLLSSLYARPLWSSSILGVVFLFSGLSSAAALMLWLAPQEEKLFYSKTDMYLISMEVFLITMFIIGGITASQVVRDAIYYLLAGPPAPWFWVLFILGGMMIPLLLETLEVLGKAKFTPLVPALVLGGSLALRFIIVYAGQAYPTFASNLVSVYSG